MAIALLVLFSIGCGGLADWGFGHMRDIGIPLNAIFGIFAMACVVSVILVLLIKPRQTQSP